jgi:hypothetical protein
MQYQNSNADNCLRAAKITGELRKCNPYLRKSPGGIEGSKWFRLAAAGGWAAVEGLLSQVLLDVRDSARQSSVGVTTGEAR